MDEGGEEKVGERVEKGFAGSTLRGKLVPIILECHPNQFSGREMLLKIDRDRHTQRKSIIQGPA